MVQLTYEDFREAAQRRLPPFLFHYADGGANDERTLCRNEIDLADIQFVQRVLCSVGSTDTRAQYFGREYTLPIVLAPIGLAGMYSRHGEIQASRAADAKNVPFVLSTVSVSSLENVQAVSKKPIWIQLYLLKDRGFVRDMLERASVAGIDTLIFTVDMPVPGIRHRDRRAGLNSGLAAKLRRLFQSATHPRWALDVGVLGRPHDLGNISHYLGKRVGMDDYIKWLGENFDPSIGWKDLEWIRNTWQGNLVIKGIMDANDAREAYQLGADGIVISNHGGRQLDGVPSSSSVVSEIADTLKGKITILADSGVRSGLDVARMLALGADGVLLGRAYLYALASGGEAGVVRLLELFEKEIRTAMILMGAETLKDINRNCLRPHLGSCCNKRHL